MSEINTDYSWLNNLSSIKKTDKTDGTNFNAVFEDEKDTGVSVDDFFNLMLQQLTNQDFMNPTDDTQYLAQLAQFATMEQMMELGEYSKQNYLSSLLGKYVTVTKHNIGGQTEEMTGRVERVGISDGDYNIYVDGNAYSLDSIKEIFAPQNDDNGDEEVNSANYFAL